MTRNEDEKVAERVFEDLWRMLKIHVGPEDPG